MEVNKKDLIQNWMNNPKKLKEDAEQFEVTKGQLEEDRCTNIAKRKYDVWPSAYASGAVVKCRQGKIWKGLKEEEEEESLDEKWSEKYKRSIDCNNPKGFSQKAHCKGRLKEGEFSKFVGSEFGDEQGNIFSVEEVYKFVEANKQKYFKPNFPISKLAHNLEWWDINYDLNNKEHKRRMMNSDTSYPLLVVNEGNNLSVADGLNRLYKAVNIENKKNIDIFLVNKEDIMFLNKKSLDEKTDFSKEKSKGLHGWFERQGGKGKSKGWVDCNTCRNVNGKKKCKTCGRQEGEKRAKYPACRPTPSACGSKGKGKSWGKKSKLSEDLFDEDLVLKRSPSDKKIYVQSDLSDESARKKETFKNKEALKKAGFTWDGKNGAWNINDVNFPIAKKTIEAINKKESLINQLEELEEIIFSAENFDGKNNLMDRIDLYINDLANATDEVAVSAEIRKYLTFFSKFRNYSLHNSMLIYIQSGGKATRVRTKPQWYNDFHRKIKKGAKAIWIFRPENLKGKTEIDAETGEEVTKQNITRFVPYPTFDIADTEPIDERGEIPEEPQWYADLEPTERSIELYKYFIELCENMGIEITKSDSERGEKGYSAGNKINISSAKEGAGEISTLVHEIAHELMHWKKSSLYYQENTDAQLRELQAESVSYVVLKHYELPTEHHPTYLALWKASKDKIKANLKVISDVASFIISEIDSIERKHKKDKNVISESRNVLLKKELEREIKLDEIKDVFKRYMGKI